MDNYIKIGDMINGFKVIEFLEEPNTGLARIEEVDHRPTPYTFVVPVRILETLRVSLNNSDKVLIANQHIEFLRRQIADLNAACLSKDVPKGILECYSEISNLYWHLREAIIRLVYSIASEESIKKGELLGPTTLYLHLIHDLETLVRDTFRADKQTTENKNE